MNVFRKKNFFLGEPVKLEEGKIITPIIFSDKRKSRSVFWDEREMNEFIDYIFKNRWVFCKRSAFCLDIAEKMNWDNFSCENCPQRGKKENIVSVEDLEREIDGCREILNLIF